MSNIFDSINSVYLFSLNELNARGTFVKSVTEKSSIGSNFGKRSRDFIELEGFSFQLTNPRNRLIYSESRKLSMGFNIANFLWFISGSKDVEPISFYNKKGKVFSNDGKYYEAAFGDRIFGSYDLLRDTKELLLSDPTSRRALIPLFFPDDLKNRPKDTPCASSIQIMIRDNKIDFFLHMRSQSVIMVFPYDIFLFTMFHEYLSLLLNKDLGVFNYYANSFHYYIDEVEMLNAILNENKAVALPMEEMPKLTVDEIPKLIKFENDIRNGIAVGRPIGQPEFDAFSDYWKELMYILCMKACYENDCRNYSFESKYLVQKLLFA